MKALRCLLLALALPGTVVGQQLKPVIRTLIPSDSSITNFSIIDSPNGRLLAYQTDDETYMWDRATGKSTATRLGDINAASWSPKGDQITFVRGTEDGGEWRIWVVDVNPNTGIPTRPARRVSVGAGNSPKFSPDGSQIAFIRADATSHSLMVVPANGGREQLLFKGLQTPGVPQWAPDGKSIYYVSRSTVAHATAPFVRNELLRVRMAGGKPEVVASPFLAPFIGASSNGRFAAVVFERQNNHPSHIVIRTMDGKEIGYVDLPPFLWPRNWSSSGLKLYGFQGVFPSAVFAIDVPTGDVRPFSGDWGQDHNPQYSPDGRSVVFQTVISNRKRIVLADADGRNRRVLQTPAQPLGDVRWSPDSRYVAFVGGHLPDRLAEILTVLDVKTGAEKKLIKADPIGPVVWRKDGSALVISVRVSADSADYVDVDLQGRTIPLLRVALVHRGNRLGVRSALLDDEWTAVYAPESIELRNLRDRTRHIVHRGHRGDNPWYDNVVGISPDGKTVALYLPEETASGRKWVTKLAPIRGGEPRYLKTGMDEGDVGVIHWLPDGRNVIVQGYVYPNDGEVPLVHIVPLNGEPWRNLFARVKAQDWEGLSISPDGRTLLVSTIRHFGGQIVEIDLTEALKNVKFP